MFGRNGLNLNAFPVLKPALHPASPRFQTVWTSYIRWLVSMLLACYTSHRMYAVHVTSVPTCFLASARYHVWTVTYCFVFPLNWMTWKKEKKLITEEKKI